MSRQISSLVTVMLWLIALYLVLRFGANAGKLIGSLSTGITKVFKTLQGR